MTTAPLLWSNPPVEFIVSYEFVSYEGASPSRGGEPGSGGNVTPHEELDDAIVAALRRIVRAIDLRSRRLFDQLGLTGPQLMVLREARRMGSAPISALARKVNLSQPTVSGIVDRLERRALVRRDRSTSDRRTVAVTITPEGGRVLREAVAL